MSIPGVNRCALVVTPQQPYADWANSFDDDGPSYHLDYHQKSPTTYLIDEPREPGNLDVILKRRWKRIFEEELSAWMIDRATWPIPRTYKMFKRWFDVTMSDLVLDLGRDYLESR